MSFSNWGDIFNDNTLANAILDRLLHNAYIVKIIGGLFKRSTGNTSSTPNS
ncbi:MAG: ATP-binding protein [Clostridia bacterium]